MGPDFHDQSAVLYNQSMIDHNRLQIILSQRHVESVIIKVLFVGLARYDIQDGHALGKQCIVQLGVRFSRVFIALYLQNAPVTILLTSKDFPQYYWFPNFQLVILELKD